MTRFRDKETGEVVEMVQVYPGAAHCVVKYPNGIERVRPYGERFRARFEPVEDEE